MVVASYGRFAFNTGYSAIRDAGGLCTIGWTHSELELPALNCQSRIFHVELVPATTD
jgi:hypothetical protein